MTKLSPLLLTLAISTSICAQEKRLNFNNRLTLLKAIEIAHSTSPTAQMAELTFMSRYWSYRSYKAEFLPSINLNGGLAKYNHSIVEARDPETGEINYVSNNTLSNNLSLSIDQRIALTGGTVSIESTLSRLDQFTYNYKTYNSEPISLRYTQPLRVFNSLKWQKKTAPLEYERSKRNYLQTMENITIQTTHYFFSVLSAQTSLANAQKNYDDTKRMYDIAKQRFAIATITKSELLQLELSLLNSEMSIRDSRVAVEVAKFNLKFYLGIVNVSTLELAAPVSIPNIALEYDFVLARALKNSTHSLNQEISRLSSEKTLAQARSARGLQLQLNANLGLSKTADEFSDVYSTLKDREIVGLTLSMPIFDWGLSKGKVKMSEAELNLAQTEIEQEEIKFRQDLMIKVLEFNNKTDQCAVAQKAMAIASERYEIMLDRFENGGVTVDNLNRAQDEMDAASNKYISQLRAFWSAYYDIQKISLYDYINKQDIDQEFDNIINRQK